mmetsp:Transcript_8437/g.7562  ORF Transcript_8437/g.7562 Transcript_8437/m.7562 type:complete len:676 (+) Transcript_8437:60-2087(+)
MQSIPSTAPMTSGTANSHLTNTSYNKNFIKKLTPIEESPVIAITSRDTSNGYHTKKDLSQSLRNVAVNPIEAKLRKVPLIEPKPPSFWDVEGSLKNVLIDKSDVYQQLSIAENGVNYSARRFNELRVQNASLTRELKSKLDDLEDLKNTHEQLELLKKSQTDEGIRIEQVKQETEKVKHEIAQKVHYSRQLNHVLDRLKRNQIRLDAHMAGMDETVRGLQREEMEVRALRNALEASLSRAITSLAETKSRLAEAKKNREVLLMQRESEIKNANQLQDWIRRREEAKIKLALELRGDLTTAEEGFLRRQILDKEEKTRHLQKATEDSQNKLQAMEDAFTKLKQVTAVSSLEEMHEKFSNQRNNKKSLEIENKDTETRLFAVKAALLKKEQELQELKSSGGGAAELSRETIANLEDAIEKAKDKTHTLKTNLDRSAAVLLSLNQGSKGLLHFVRPFLSLADGGVFDLTQTDDELPWADTLEALSTAEQVLAKMLDTLNGDGINGPALKMGSADEDDEGQSPNKGNDSFSSLKEIPALANNVSVKSMKIQEQLASHWWNDDEADNDFPIANQNIDVSNEFELFPERAIVKKLSHSISQDAKRKEEQEIRRKRLQDRMAGKGGQEDGRIEDIAKLKAQKAMANRLSTSHHLATLPPGVKLSDDVLTKADAFLKSKPDLT